jgi:hypothetical protein
MGPHGTDAEKRGGQEGLRFALWAASFHDRAGYEVPEVGVDLADFGSEARARGLARRLSPR